MNATNSLQLAAIHGAANRGWTSIIQILADAGAKLDVKDVGGRTPMTFAERHLPRDSAAGGQARGHRAAEEAGREMNRILFASCRRVRRRGLGRRQRTGGPARGGRQPAAQHAPRVRPADADRRLSAGPTATPATTTALKTGGLSLEGLSLDRGADAETWEKVVRKVRAGLDAAGRREAARARGARRVRRLDRDRHRSRRGGQPQSRARAAAPHEPRRVRERDPRSAGARRRFLDPAAGRRLEPRLRQHRRRARRVAVAARALRGGGRQDQPAGRRRTRRRAGAGDLHGQGRSQPEPDARRASRSARAAARPSRTTSPSTAST